jgi:hypothetical protein
MHGLQVNVRCCCCCCWLQVVVVFGEDWTGCAGARMQVDVCCCCCCCCWLQVVVVFGEDWTGCCVLVRRQVGQSCSTDPSPAAGNIAPL